MTKLLDLPARSKSETGSVVIYVALVLFLLLGMAALAVDTGYNRVVRNQLQNAADAAALAACNHFYDRTAGPPDLDDPTAICPDWSAASAEGANAITINSSDNNALQTGTINVGWWDIVRPLNPDQWATPPSTPTCTPPTQMYGPAVRVTILKASGQNSGAMPTFFGKILGVSTIDVDASATAVAASPGSVRPDAVMPYAVSKQSADLWPYYDKNAYDATGKVITLGDPYHCNQSGCYPGGTEDTAGQFTTFVEELQNVTAMRGIIDTGNTTLLSIGSQIWLQSGVERTLYDSPQQVSLLSEYEGKTVALPVVDAYIPQNVGAFAPVAGYIGFHVVCVGKSCAPLYGTGVNEKIVMGYFTTPGVYGTGPVGPHFGPIDRCRLAR